MGIARNLGISIAGLVGIGALIYHFRGQLGAGAGTVGQTIGQAIGQGVASIPKGIFEGAGSIFAQAGGEDPLGLKKSYSDFLNAIGWKNDGKITGGIFPTSNGDTGGTGRIVTGVDPLPNNEEMTSQNPKQKEIYSYAVSELNVRTTRPPTFNQIFNPFPVKLNVTNPTPILGLYDLKNTKFGEQLPLSQNAIDYYRKIGVGVKRVGNV